MNKFTEELTELFERRVLTDMKNRVFYSTDKCPKNLIDKVLPCAAVVAPSRLNYKKELSDLIKLVKKYGKKIVVRGGASGVCGALTPHDPKNTVMVDMSNFDFISTLNLLGGYVVVGAGILGSDMENYLNMHFRVTTGHSPASLEISTPGGWVATRSSGQFSACYGTIEDIVLGVEAVTADGTARWYEDEELKYFFRMEGSTGIITRVKIKISPLRDYQKFMAVSFNCLEKAMRAMEFLFDRKGYMEKYGVCVSAVRLYDWLDYNFISKPHKRVEGSENGDKNKKYRLEKFMARHPFLANLVIGCFEKSTMLILIESDDSRQLHKTCEDLSYLFEEKFDGCGENGEVAENWHQNRFKLNWKKLEGRFENGLIVDTFDCKPKDFDSALAVYEKVIESVSSKAIIGTHFGLDKSGPYIYFSFAASVKKEKKLKFYKEIWKELILSSGGMGFATTTHHHGIGLLKAGDDNILSLFAYGSDWINNVAVPAKKKLDPDNLFNPGKIFPPRYL